MTTRLLGRWALLLSRCPQASAFATHLKTHAALTVEPLWSQARIQTPVRPLCVGRENAQEEKPKHTSKHSSQLLVVKATTPEEVLKIWQNVGGTSNEAGRYLIKLNTLVAKSGMDTAEILKDPRFAELLKAVNIQVSAIWHNTLVSLLRALADLGVSPRSEVLQSLYNEALWRIRRLNLRHLSLLVDWASGRPEYKDANEVLTTAALKQLELRWTELAEPRVVRVLMSRSAYCSPSLMEKLEDKALELANRFTAHDIRNLFQVLALQSRRAVALLRALSYHLVQKPSTDLNTPLLLDIAYAYGKLNFQHVPMLQRMTAELFVRLQDLTPIEVSQCSKSLAFLKWLHQPLFEGFAQHFLSETKQFDTLQLCNLLMSFAKLNFQPCNLDFYKKVHETLERSWEKLEPFLLTDVVWSLCVLQQAKPEYITAVTDPAFQTKLAEDSIERRDRYRLKLLQIAASSHLESLGASSVQPTIPLPVPKGNTPSPMSLQSSLYKALQSLTKSCPTALRTDVNTVYGWTVDAELVVDSENKPIDLENLVAPHLPGGGGLEQLPQGAHRVAFLVWDFGDFIFNSKELLGRFAMQKRHLQLAGFLVVEVPYFEWQELKSDWGKVAYLKDNISKVVAQNRDK